MSIEALTNLRLQRKKPRSVCVLVGNVPKWVEDDEKTVIVRKAGSFDFRALIGLDVSVIEVGNDWPLLAKVLTAVESAKPKSINVCGTAGAVGSGEHPMQKMRELLCNS